MKVIKENRQTGIRFIIIDENTGEILDDAQGYGYKTYKGALAAFYYKNRTPEQKEKERENVYNACEWMDNNQQIVQQFEDNCWYNFKDSLQSNDEPLSHKELFIDTLNAFGLTVKDLNFDAKYIYAKNTYKLKNKFDKQKRKNKN